MPTGWLDGVQRRDELKRSMSGVIAEPAMAGPMIAADLEHELAVGPTTGSVPTEVFNKRVCRIEGHRGACHTLQDVNHIEIELAVGQAAHIARW